MKKERVFQRLGKMHLNRRRLGKKGHKDTLRITQPRKRDDKGLQHG